MHELSFAHRVWILIALLAVSVVVAAFVDPIPQDPAYHLFADTRSFWGVPNFNDVVSNLGFAIVGPVALFTLISRRDAIFVTSADARPYVVFFLGVGLVSIGSAYYHWEPSNERLLWDRLPMSIAFMAISSGVVADRVDAKTGNGWLLLLLVALGLGSLVYWSSTESVGRGDLTYTIGRFLIWALVWYGLSKVFEFLDPEIYAALGISGHTLKHLAAAAATYVLFRMLLVRSTRPKEAITSPG
jgi:hypothetical protein